MNLLLVRQSYLVKKLHQGYLQKLTELKVVQREINQWYEEDSRNIKVQSKKEDYNEDEQVRIYYHEIHQKHIRKSATPKLNDTLLEGHDECAAFLENSVKEITAGTPNLDEFAQKILLDETEKVFTDKHNKILMEKPTKDEVYKVCLSLI